MDSDRKYAQRGYQDSGRGERREGGERPKPQGPRPPIDVTGPRLPRLVASVTASRCFNCAVSLPAGTEFNSTCPKCGAQLHCCKQCTHFDPSTRFQCTKPVPVRIVLKDQRNDCNLFSPRVTVARDTSAPNGSHNGGRSAAESILASPPRTPLDAKNAFERLFKK